MNYTKTHSKAIIKPVLSISFVTVGMRTALLQIPVTRRATAGMYPALLWPP